MLPRKEFINVMKAALLYTKNPIKPQFNTILFKFQESGKLQIVATNGAVLFIADLQCTREVLGAPMSFTAPSINIAEAIKTIKTDDRVALTPFGTELSITSGQQFYLSPISDDFPDYQPIREAENEIINELIRLNGNYLKDASKAPGLYDTIELIPQGADNPLIIRPVLDSFLESVKNIEIYIMGMRL